jgi:hypothetical protein
MSPRLRRQYQIEVSEGVQLLGREARLRPVEDSEAESVGDLTMTEEVWGVGMGEKSATVSTSTRGPLPTVAA